jgi:hypothetical protein
MRMSGGRRMSNAAKTLRGTKNRQVTIIWPDGHRTPVRVSDAEYGRLSAAAEIEGISIGEFMLRAARRSIEE